MGQMKQSVTLTRYGRGVLFLIGLVEVAFMLLIAIGLASTSGIDFLFFTMLFLAALGIWLMSYAHFRSATLDTYTHVITIRRPWRGGKTFPVAYISYYDRTVKTLYLYDASQHEIGRICINNMKNVEFFIQQLCRMREIKKISVSHKNDTKLATPAYNGSMVMIILGFVFFFCGGIILCSNPDMLATIIVSGFLIVCIGVCAGVIYWQKTHFWYQEEGMLVHQCGSENTYYLDQDLQDVIDCSTQESSRVTRMQVSWSGGRKAEFILDGNLFNWLALNGYTPDEIKKHSEDYAQRMEQEETRAQGEHAAYSENMVMLVRVLCWIIGIVSLCMMFIVGKMQTTMKEFYTVISLMPISNMILPCIFPKMFEIEKPKYRTKDYKKRHIALPFLFLMGEAVIYLLLTPKIEIRTGGKAALLGVTLFLIQTGLVLLCVLVRKGDKRIAFMLIFTLMICAIGQTESAIIIGTDQNTEHEYAVVMDMNIARGKSDSYYLTVSGMETSSIRMEVSRSMYEDMRIGDSVKICKNHSIFGIEYWMLHE